MLQYVKLEPARDMEIYPVLIIFLSTAIPRLFHCRSRVSLTYPVACSNSLKLSQLMATPRIAPAVNNMGPIGITWSGGCSCFYVCSWFVLYCALTLAWCVVEFCNAHGFTPFALGWYFFLMSYVVFWILGLRLSFTLKFAIYRRWLRKKCQSNISHLIRLARWQTKHINK